MPLSFEVNQGQIDGQANFVSRGQGYTLFLTPSEALMSLHKGAAATKGEEASVGTALRMKLIGANVKTKVVGLEELSGRVNYFYGHDPIKWRTNIPTYAKVKYQNVYPGIDLIYYGNQGQLEYNLVVFPGFDPKKVTLDFEGAEQIEVNEQGNLLLRVTGGQIQLQKPIIYQEIDGVRKEVVGSFALKGANQVGFQVSAYDIA
ncbi:hypothetical protein HYR54_00930 [Candidatus Acetothermia bacterium]|nr:hypothetical protein [Candidatus Acetothermia bacterium]